MVSFSAHLDEEVENWGIRVPESPVRMPTANAHYERLIGTKRRECLDYVIPFCKRHLLRIVREWTSQPHSYLGPGIPDSVRQNAPDWEQVCGLLWSSTVIANQFSAALHHADPSGKA